MERILDLELGKIDKGRPINLTIFMDILQCSVGCFRDLEESGSLLPTSSLNLQKFITILNFASIS